MPRRYLLILTAALLTSISSARAQNVGLSYLGICHKSWPCADSLAAFDGVSVIRTGWLENTFNSACPCGDVVLKDPRPKVIRVHLSNGPCLRNQRCGSYEVFAGETIASANRKVKRGDKRLMQKFGRVVNRFAKRLENTRGVLSCYVSPVLESDLDGRARGILLDYVGLRLPGCRLVDSIVRGRCLPGTICEKHGDKPSLSNPCIADLDGAFLPEVSVPDYLQLTRQCDISYIWDVGFNCNQWNVPFVDPRARRCTQSRGYFQRLATWLR
jgi:hypothetical protein